MTPEEILLNPIIHEFEERLKELRAELVLACEQPRPGDFVDDEKSAIMDVARKYKHQWNARNLAVADIVKRS